MGPMPHPVWLTVPRIAPAHDQREFNAPHRISPGVNDVLLWVYFPTRTTSDVDFDQVFLVSNTFNSFGIDLLNQTRRLDFGSGANSLQLKIG